MTINWDSPQIPKKPCYECSKQSKRKMVFSKIDGVWLTFCSKRCFVKSAYKISKLRKFEQ